MTHDYQSLIKTLANADISPELLHETVTPQEYQFVIDTLLFKIFDRDYLDDTESDLINKLPEVVNQPRLSQRYISPLFLSYLRQHPQNIDHFYVLLRSYLALKIDNLEPLSVDEIFILSHIPELDEGQVMTLPITSELLSFAAKHPERLTNEQFHCLSLHINAKVTDRQVLSPEEDRVFDYLSSTINVDDLVTEFSQETPNNTDIPSPELASMEYGYDIYDFSDLIQRLESADYENRYYGVSETINNLNRPLSMREIRVIKQAWAFDPSNESQRLAVLQPYWAAHDVLDPDGSHDRYVAGMQRYRERV